MKTAQLFLIGFILFNSNIFAQKEEAIIYKSDEAPVIDGIEDDLWQLAQPNYLNKNFQRELPTLTAYWKMLWDNENIYVLVNVDDDDHFPAWETGSAWYQFDNVELYFDLNKVLKDGKGASIASSGHWQCSPSFQPDYYGGMHFYIGSLGGQLPSYYAYQLVNQGYVYEFKISFENMLNNNHEALTPSNILNRNIGFDVTVADQDEGITTSRERKTWSQDGFTTVIDESWNNMDDAGIIRFESLINNNDSVVCGTDNSFYFSIDVPIENVIQYSWDLDGGVLIQSNKNSCRAKWDEPGKKEVTLTVKNVNNVEYQFKKSLTVYPRFSVDIGENFSTCKKTPVQIIAKNNNGVLPFTYSWNNQNGNNTFIESIEKSKSISLKVVDSVGCIATNSVFISVLTSIYPDQICKVSIDNSNNDNKIEWSKSSNKDIREYQILKESKVVNQYDVIGTVAYEDVNFFIDENSNPSKYADRYLMLTVDKCGNVSLPCEVHKNIHLQVSAGLPGNYNLSWTPYIGFEYGSYFIYKGHSLEDMKMIDQVSSSNTEYTDTSSTQVYYQVAVRRNSGCVLTTDKSVTELSEARSNFVYLSKSSSQQLDSRLFKVFPNPTNGVVKLSIDITENMSYKITDLSGKILRNQKLKEPLIDISNLNPGQYVVTIIDQNNSNISFPIQKE